MLSAHAGTVIHISEGVYVVDNPIVLTEDNVRIYGAGADRTVIRPMNIGKPVFRFEANGLTIEKLTINAQTVQIDGAVMRSEITANLYATLAVTEKDGIGLVRAPFMRFRGGNPAESLWYLSHEDNDVIVVSSVRGGPTVRFMLLSEGKPSLLDSIKILKEKILLKYLN